MSRGSQGGLLSLQQQPDYPAKFPLPNTRLNTQLRSLDTYIVETLLLTFGVSLGC